MSPAARVDAYRRQTGRRELTPRQQRRHRRAILRSLPTFDLSPVAYRAATVSAPQPGGDAGTGAAPAPAAARPVSGGGGAAPEVAPGA